MKSIGAWGIVLSSFVAVYFHNWEAIFCLLLGAYFGSAVMSEDKSISNITMKLPEKLHDDDLTVPNVRYLHRTINALIDYLAEREGEKLPEQWGKDVFTGERKEIPISKTITLPKPEWWDRAHPTGNEIYQEALEAASRASAIKFELI